MKIQQAILGLGIWCTALGVLSTAGAVQVTAVRPEYQAPDVNPDLPNVLLLGDSISIGYTLPLRAELSGEANVFRPATNCGPTTNGLRSIDNWLGDREWDVIHFNFGLHDLKFMGPKGENLADPADSTSHRQVPIEQYAVNLKRIAERLKQTGAVVIWRETTPVPAGSKGRIAGDAVDYNQAAAKAMSEVGDIQIDPMFMYANTDPIASLQKPANVHYTAAGSKALAQRAAESIRSALK